MSQRGLREIPSTQYICCEPGGHRGGTGSPARSTTVGKISVASDSAAVRRGVVWPGTWTMNGMRVPCSKLHKQRSVSSVAKHAGSKEDLQKSLPELHYVKQRRRSGTYLVYLAHWFSSPKCQPVYSHYDADRVQIQHNGATLTSPQQQYEVPRRKDSSGK